MLNLQKIKALVELERVGWDVTPSGPNEVKCKCPDPNHEDQIASCSLNTEKNVWLCHTSSCKAHGDIISFLCYILKVERTTILADLETRYPGLTGKKQIRPERIEEWHNAIWNAGPLLQELYKRGITDDQIREQKIGYSLKEQRIMIPVFDLERRIINVRRYLPGAPGPDKTKNIRGYNTQAIYLPEQLKYPTLWICGGELKALCATRFLNSSNVGAIAYTGAEGAWHESLTPQIKGKTIFICMDIDDGGRVGARRLAAQIYSQIESIHIVNLGHALDIKKYPKGDINDWVGSENAGEADFATAMSLATKYIPPYYQEQDESKITAIKCSLLQARKSETVNQKIETSFVISMLDAENYLVPKDLKISCTRDASCCGSCIVNSKKTNEKTGLVSVTLLPMNQEFLGLIGINQRRKSMGVALLDAMGIPDCNKAKIDIESYYNVADVRLGTEMDLESNLNGNTDLNQPAFIVGLTEEQIELNIPYIGTGRNFPDPNHGASVLLLNKLERKEDTLSTFALTAEENLMLQPFRR